MSFELCLGLERLPPDAAVTRREAVRGVVVADGKVLLIRTNRGDFKFPGGGVEAGESAEEALKREMLEETGYPNCQVGRLLGRTMERDVDAFDPGAYFEMRSLYFLCTVDLREREGQRLDDYEREQVFTPCFLPPAEALEANRRLLAEARPDVNRWVWRDTMVLAELIERKG